MNNTDYQVHPYCLLFVLTEGIPNMPQVDCTRQAKGVEVYNDDGFIYSEYTKLGHDKPLRVGYRLPTVIKPVTKSSVLLEVLIDDTKGRQYGSIVGGVVVSPTVFEPAIRIQCGDRARGGDPRIIQGNRAGLTYTTAATMKGCLNPKVAQTLCIAGPNETSAWFSAYSNPSTSIEICVGADVELCDDPTNEAGRITSYLELECYAIKLLGIKVDEGKLVVAA